MVRRKKEKVEYILDRGPPDKKGKGILVRSTDLPRIGERILLMSYASNKDQQHRLYEVKGVTHTVGYFETNYGYYNGRNTPQKPIVEVREVKAQ